MPLLTLSQVKKTYGAEIILDGVSMQMQPGEKAGLIGPNGSGKTTLLKIISGEIEADSGEIHLARGAKTGYLPQEPLPLTEGTLRRHLEHPLRHILDMKEEMGRLEERIARRAESEGEAAEKDLERYSALTSRFEEAGGYQVEKKLLGIARGLGFTETDLKRDLATFSGGEKTRARLAGLLLQDLDLLLLDEPTNFLDLSALEWLEKYLRDLNCALLVVTHDRFFLDRLAGRIFALRGHRVKSYNGNYSSYQEQLALEHMSSEREYRRLQLIKAREERLVREAKGDERSKRQAKSRQKHLEKMEDKMEGFERPTRDQSFKLGLGYSGRSGHQVVIFDSVCKEFDGKSVFHNLSFNINWGDRVALIGPNGAGKSTLLKLIAGDLKPTSGSIKLGPSVEVTYFAQEQEQLDPYRTLLETITDSSELDLKQARNHLGSYLFQGDDVFKRAGDLSGGEKNRLALARLALKSGNCLLMDEPTSHLDMPALEEIETVLAHYPGTLIIVSHDRYFLKGLANRVFELEEGRINIHDLSFERYLEEKEKESVRAARKDRASDQKQEEKKRRQEEHRRRQAEQKEHRRLRDEQVRLEEEISAREEEIKGLEETLADPESYGDHSELADLGARLEEARNTLTRLMKSWEEVTARLEEGS